MPSATWLIRICEVAVQIIVVSSEVDRPPDAVCLVHEVTRVNLPVIDSVFTAVQRGKVNIVYKVRISKRHQLNITERKVKLHPLQRPVANQLLVEPQKVVNRRRFPLLLNLVIAVLRRRCIVKLRCKVEQLRAAQASPLMRRAGLPSSTFP